MFDRIQHMHLVGIGGIGLSALGKLFALRGVRVTGSDASSSEVLEGLRHLGVHVHVGHHADHLSEQVELLIYSPAVPETNPERQEAVRRGIPQLSYPQALGELSKQFSTIVVTGTHGKSTTTAMLGLILEEAGYDPTVIVGSLVPSFVHGNVRVGGGRFLVVEGCEHQANMLNLHPEMIVLTSIEADHLDYYKTLENVQAAFQTFVNKLAGQGMVVVNADDPVSQQLHIARPVQYGQSPSAHYRFTDRTVRDGAQVAQIMRCIPEHMLGELTLHIPGAFNVSNALAAVSAAMELGVPFETCERVMARYTGIWRRFERVGTYRGAEVISDYGHHPTAVRLTVEAARELFPEKKILLCFQPHQHSRTSALFDEFVEALQSADVVVVPEIYRVEGRTEDESVSSAHLVAAVKQARPESAIYFAQDFPEAQQLLDQLLQTHSNAVLIVQGAGTVDQIARGLVK